MKTIHFFVAAVRAGQTRNDSSLNPRPFFFESKEEAIHDLHRKFYRWMDEKCFWRVNGEVIEDDDYQVTFDGATGWYDCDGDLLFEDGEYPEKADEWVARDITHFTHDVYTYQVMEHVTEEDDDDEQN